MKKRKRYLYKLIIFILLLIISAGAVTTAWLSNNLELDSENEQIQIRPLGMTVEDYYVYRYDMRSNTVDLLPKTGYYAMTPYDSIFEERNINTPLLFVIKIRDIEPEQEVVTFQISCAPGHPFTDHIEGANPSADNYTSNIVHTIVTLSTLTGITPVVGTASEDVATRTQFFDDVVRWFDDDANSSNYSKDQFVSVNGGAFTKKDYTQVSFTAPQDHPTSVYVYLLLDYDKELISHQRIDHFGDIDISKGPLITYTNDITQIHIF